MMSVPNPTQLYSEIDAAEARSYNGFLIKARWLTRIYSKGAPVRSLRKILFPLVVACLSVLGWATSAGAFGGFIENRGQVDSRAKYYCLGSRAAVYFTQDAVVIDLKEEMRNPKGRGHHQMPYEEMMAEAADSVGQRGCAVYIRFEAASPSPVIEARGELETKYNYFLGSDPTRWRTEVPAFSEVVYRDAWPGVDLVFREDDGGRLTYEAVLSPGADGQMVQFRYEGADRVTKESDGSFLVETPVGSLREERAVAGGKVGVFMLAQVNRELLESGGSTAPEDNPSALLWSTFLGGSGLDAGASVALDATGNAVVTGLTGSSDFPSTPGAYDTSLNGYQNIFVAKLSASGSALLWGTFLGGSLDDEGCSLILDASGNAVVTGYTTSSDFPTTPGAYDTSYNGGYYDRDVFVAKLSASGSTLLWSTFLGGSDFDYARSLVLDPSGNPVVAGYTESSDFPTTPGVYDTSYNGSEDVFVTKISASGSALLWSTFLGGSGSDVGTSVVLDASGNAVVTGYTQSSDFPTTPGAYDTSFNGGYYDWDVFVAKLSASGSALVWSTFLGGSREDDGYSLVLDASANAVVTGFTASSNFPTTPGAYDTSYYNHDIFVAKLSASGSALLWSTFLGGSDDDSEYSLVLDALGSAVVTGETQSSDFPTTPGAYDTSFNGGSYGSDVFVAKLSASGSALVWSTFLGGGGNDVGYSLVLDASGNAVLTGWTSPSGFPTTPGAYDTSHDGGTYDVFVAKLSMAMVDSTPPNLAVGILQNPYLTQYLDIYVVSSEVLYPGTVKLTVGGHDVGVRLLDGAENVWVGDYEVAPPGGAVSISCSASDMAGNDTTVTTTFSSTLLLADRGGTAMSPDEKVALRLGPGALKGDAYIMVLPLRDDATASGVLRASYGDSGIRILAPDGTIARSYYIGASGALGGSGAYLEFRYDDCGLGPGCTPDQLYIVQDGIGQLQCYVDPEKKTVGAPVSSLGSFSLRSGAPGTSMIADSKFLRVEPASPNPFSETTAIRYEIRAPQPVAVTVYDIGGRQVASLRGGLAYPGVQSVTWDGRSSQGVKVSSGVYLIRVETPSGSLTAKMTLVR
jgi:hypothetical protein